MCTAIDLTGVRFGRLTAISVASHTGRGRKWLCRCDCGNERAVMAAKLREGSTRSCGCLSIDKTRERRIASRKNVELRFWEKVSLGDGCWEWHGVKGEYGHGQ